MTSEKWHAVNLTAAAETEVPGKDVTQLVDDEPLVCEWRLRANAGIVASYVTEQLGRREVHELLGVRDEIVDDDERRLLAADAEFLDAEIRVKCEIHERAVFSSGGRCDRSRSSHSPIQLVYQHRAFETCL